jgi:hypothetical protein
MKKVLTTINPLNSNNSSSTIVSLDNPSPVKHSLTSSSVPRQKIENLSRVNPETSLFITNSLNQGERIIGQAETLINSGMRPILGGIHNFFNSNSSAKQLLAAFAGASMLLTGVVKGIIDTFNLLSGKSTGKFKIGEIIASSMIGWLGYDALQYAQGKSNALNSSQSILAKVIPIIFMKGFNSMLSNPNSATAKIANAIGLKEPTQSLISDLGGMVNPAKLFG